MVSVYSPGHPGIYSEDQYGLYLTEIFISLPLKFWY